MERYGQHPDGGVEPERKLRGAVVAQPEMFTPVKLPPVAVEFRAEFRGESFRQEQLTFAKRSEGNCAGWVGAFMQHGQSPVFSGWSLVQRDSANIAREGPKLGLAD